MHPNLPAASVKKFVGRVMGTKEQVAVLAPGLIRFSRQTVGRRFFAFDRMKG
jgi:hypothetical protein